MTDTIIRRIMQEAEKNDGIIRTGQIEELGIPRRNIRLLLDAGALVKESKGLYSVPEISPDEYAVLQSRSDMLIFSYGTALFFHGLSDRVPHTIDITVPQGYNVMTPFSRSAIVSATFSRKRVSCETAATAPL